MLIFFLWNIIIKYWVIVVFYLLDFYSLWRALWYDFKTLVEIWFMFPWYPPIFSFPSDSFVHREFFTFYVYVYVFSLFIFFISIVRLCVFPFLLRPKSQKFNAAKNIKSLLIFPSTLTLMPVRPVYAYYSRLPALVFYVFYAVILPLFYFRLRVLFGLIWIDLNAAFLHRAPRFSY